MKTLMGIFALLIGITMGVNAQTKTMVKISDLPKAISANLSSQHKDWTPTEAFKVDTKGLISYEVVAKKESNQVKLLYDKEGKFTKSEPMMAMKSETKKESTPVKTTTESKTSSTTSSSHHPTQKSATDKKTEKH
jgi:hypothetical protein